MKIVGFSVNNYRSIKKAYKLQLDSYSVLLGPNNEGKSNILLALVLCLKYFQSGNFPALKRRRRVGRYPYSSNIDDFFYEWENDFPVDLKIKSKEKTSEFTIEFEFNETEKQEFYKTIKNKIRTNMQIKIRVNESHDVSIEILMKGSGKKSLNSKIDKIRNFINDRLSLIYIPSIRTKELSYEVIQNIIDDQVRFLRMEPDYLELLDQLKKIEEPILDGISEKLTEMVLRFIPNIKNISIENSLIQRDFRCNYELYMDDGVKTSISQKGDGVISLTAIAFMQYASKLLDETKNIFVVIEEPESHLHPQAIHSLKDVLIDISNTNQVLVSTHSPLLINSMDIHQNILVKNRRAEKVKKIDEIRKAFGIYLSDNLVSSEFILIVEGEDDKIYLDAVLKNESNTIQKAFQNNLFTIVSLDGVSKLVEISNMYKNWLCKIFVFIDNDNEARKHLERARQKNIINEREIFLSTPNKKKDEMELEDLYMKGVYEEYIKKEYGVSTYYKVFKDAISKNKWSDALEKLFVHNGKPWDKTIEMKIKAKVARLAAEKGLNAIHEANRGPIKCLMSNIENSLDRKGNIDVCNTPIENR